jgi:thermitase
MSKYKKHPGAYLSRLQQLRQRVPARAMLLGLVVAAVGVVGLRFGLAENSIPETSEDPRSSVVSAESEAVAVAAEEQIIVRYKPTIAEGEIDGSIASVDAVQKEEIEQLDMKVVQVPKERRQQTIDALNQDPRVEYAEAVGIVRIATTEPNDTYFIHQWFMRSTLVDLLWDKHKGGSDVVVAVADTGIAFDHEDLPGGRIVPGRDFVNAGDNDPTDTQGHGTMVAGVVAATANNGLGVAGVCWSCRIMPLRAISGDGTGTAADSVEALVYAADNGADIVNMSFGSEGEYQAMKDAVAYAAGKGVIMTAAAMNEGIDRPFWPARYEPVISVGGTNADDTRHPESDYGSTVDIASPYTVTTTGLDGDYVTAVGTSFASPTVAGILAVFRSAFPNATPAQLRNAITSTADPCCNGEFGGGRINAIKAYNLLAGAQNADTVKPTVNILSPAGGSTVSGADLRTTATAADNVGVAKVHMQLNGSEPVVDTVAPYLIYWDPITTDGPRTLTVTAYDAAGNSTKATRTFTVTSSHSDTTKPAVTVTAPAEGATVSGNLQINVTATDASGISIVELYKGTSLVATDIEAPYSFTQNTTQLPEGENSVAVRATDVNGNFTDVFRKYVVRNTTTPPGPPNPPNPNPTPKSADLNKNGRVDLPDLSTLLSNWNKTTAASDLNSNGKVDLTDLSMLLSKWNTPG